MDNSRTALARVEAERHRAREGRRASFPCRLVDAAGIDPAALTPQAASSTGSPSGTSGPPMAWSRSSARSTRRPASGTVLVTGAH